MPPMNNLEAALPSMTATAAEVDSLGNLPPHIDARIEGFRPEAVASDSVLPALEMERRLVEMGFIEGAKVRIEYRGGLRGDPLGVRIDGQRLVALRRKEAYCIAVNLFRENNA